jgi:fermentation-respiration switch protein FrsA (DUF1100 family)
MRTLMSVLTYFPERDVAETPSAVGLEYEELAIKTTDGERLQGWWVPAPDPALGQIVLFHGNAGNIGNRVEHVSLLVHAGFDVAIFDYRGYGQSTGSPSEGGTYADARAALGAFSEVGCDPLRAIFLGESLGGAIALRMALESPPRGLILQCAFTSIRDMGRFLYPYIPSIVVPDAYPSLRRIRALRSPLLVIHGDRDAVTPAAHGRALFDAAPGPKRLEIFGGRGHNELLLDSAHYVDVISDWVQSLPTPVVRG